VTNGVVTWFVFDGLSVVMELDSSKKPTTIITPGVCKTRLDLAIPLTEYYLFDGLGSVIQITDVIGNATQEYQYDPFGATRNVKSDPFNRYRFVGLAHDDFIGLTYANARWYAPNLGRFLSRDPQAQGVDFDALSQTQNLSSYIYASNNPVSELDVTGRYKKRNKEECIKLSEHLRHLRDELAKREAEQAEHEGMNPERDAGHKRRIGQLKDEISEAQEKYNKQCRDNEPSPEPATEPALQPSGGDVQAPDQKTIGNIIAIIIIIITTPIGTPLPGPI
jgi:RHS repeat-associated protein